jgi:hypothetical protein
MNFPWTVKRVALPALLGAASIAAAPADADTNRPTPKAASAAIQDAAPQSYAAAARRVRTASARRPARRIVLPAGAVKLAAKHRRKAGKAARTGSNARAARYTMPKRQVKKLLRVSWRAFGFRGHRLRVRVARNYRQVVRESGARPAVLQGFIGDVNDHRPAGGLLQFTASTFNHWKVRGHNDRFNPLDNLLAGVNAQVHGPYPVLRGASGWSPPMVRNPLKSKRAVKLIRA